MIQSAAELEGIVGILHVLGDGEAAKTIRSLGIQAATIGFNSFFLNSLHLERQGNPGKLLGSLVKRLLK